MYATGILVIWYFPYPFVLVNDQTLNQIRRGHAQKIPSAWLPPWRWTNLSHVWCTILAVQNIWTSYIHCNWRVFCQFWIKSVAKYCSNANLKWLFAFLLLLLSWPNSMSSAHLCVLGKTPTPLNCTLPKYLFPQRWKEIGKLLNNNRSKKQTAHQWTTHSFRSKWSKSMWLQCICTRFIEVKMEIWIETKWRVFTYDNLTLNFF